MTDAQKCSSPGVMHTLRNQRCHTRMKHWCGHHTILTMTMLVGSEHSHVVASEGCTSIVGLKVIWQLTKTKQGIKFHKQITFFLSLSLSLRTIYFAGATTAVCQHSHVEINAQFKRGKNCVLCHWLFTWKLGHCLLVIWQATDFILTFEVLYMFIFIKIFH